MMVLFVAWSICLCVCVFLVMVGWAVQVPVPWFWGFVFFPTTLGLFKYPVVSACPPCQVKVWAVAFFSSMELPRARI